ncbi:MAG: hypothetical protein CM15mP128_1870 [Methanobacteriota archaeon]|nr:MAG: hypothetical protein CM15mP128_1870 [Euryarchaeota archaeon]
MQATLDGAVIVALHVQPGASSASLAGFDAWRNRIVVRLTARAQAGQANRALCAQLAAWLGCPASSVTIIEGTLHARSASGSRASALMRCLQVSLRRPVRPRGQRTSLMSGVTPLEGMRSPRVPLHPRHEEARGLVGSAEDQGSTGRPILVEGPRD